MAAKKTSTTTTPSKSDFIRSQPTTMPVAEIVEKAKAQGLKFDASLVYKVRHRPSAKGKTKTSAARKALTSMNGASKKPTPSKADFVRSLPSSTPAKEVVAKARAAGVSISETHVYGVRTADKAAKKEKAAKKTTRSQPSGTADDPQPPCPLRKNCCGQSPPRSGSGAPSSFFKVSALACTRS